MKLLVETAIIFFGTLFAAGLVALGEPAPTGNGMQATDMAHHSFNALVESAKPWVELVSSAAQSAR